jgi:hypothetical protein
MARDRPLSLNFPNTFLPERSLLADLLRFAHLDGAGDKSEISEKTGIPTGASSGKVEPIIEFAEGMGLIEAERKNNIWHLRPDKLGKIILQEDEFISEPLSMWLMHLMLCRRFPEEDPVIGIADAWFSLFASGSFRLGRDFDQPTFQDYLSERHGSKNYLKPLSSLVIRTYLEPSCFGPIDALKTEDRDGVTFFVRQVAPVEPSFFPGYSAYFFITWDSLFPDARQVEAEEFFNMSFLQALLGWDQVKMSTWLDWMADRGLVQLDRQTGGTLVLKLRDTSSVVSEIFDDLI